MSLLRFQPKAIDLNDSSSSGSITKPSMNALFDFEIDPNEKITVHKAGEKPQLLGIKEFSEKFKISFTHGLHYDAKDKYIVDQIYKSSQTEQSKKIHFKNYFDVIYINDKVGYGLIANQDIPKDTLVDIYGGLLKFFFCDGKGTDSLPFEETDYFMGAGLADKITKPGDKNEHCVQIIIDAKKYGGLARFAPHFPTEQELENETGEGIEDNNILYCNMTFRMEEFNGVEAMCIRTTENIKKGELAAINYGRAFANRMPDQCIFVKSDKGIRIAYRNKETRKFELSNEVVYQPTLESIHSSSPTSLNRHSSFYHDAKSEYREKSLCDFERNYRKRRDEHESSDRERDYSRSDDNEKSRSNEQIKDLRDAKPESQRMVKPS